MIDLPKCFISFNVDFFPQNHLPKKINFLKIPNASFCCVICFYVIIRRLLFHITLAMHLMMIDGNSSILPLFFFFNLAICPCFETIQVHVPVLKFNFNKIELCQMKLKKKKKNWKSISIFNVKLDWQKIEYGESNLKIKIK